MTAILARELPDVAASIYSDYVRHFQVKRFGHRVFREYPEGEKTLVADVDSGPIVLGAGAAATGIGLAAARAAGDTATESDTAAITAMFGFSRKVDGGKGPGVQYLYGLLPIGDGFLAWAWSLERQDLVKQADQGQRGKAGFHGWAFTLTGLIVLQYVWAWKRGRRRWREAG